VCNIDIERLRYFEGIRELSYHYANYFYWHVSENYHVLDIGLYQSLKTNTEKY